MSSWPHSSRDATATSTPGSSSSRSSLWTPTSPLLRGLVTAHRRRRSACSQSRKLTRIRKMFNGAVDHVTSIVLAVFITL
jgi:hypothetical protein